MNPLKTPLLTAVVFILASFLQYAFGTAIVLGWSNGVDTPPFIFMDENPNLYWRYIYIEFGIGIFFLSLFFLQKCRKK